MMGIDLYPTPPEVAARLWREAKAALDSQKMRLHNIAVIDPSTGTGNLLKAAKANLGESRYHKHALHAVEIDPRLRAILANVFAARGLRWLPNE